MDKNKKKLLVFLFLSLLPSSIAMTEKDLTIMSRELVPAQMPKKWLIYPEMFLAKYLFKLNFYLKHKDSSHKLYIKYLLNASGVFQKLSKRENIRITSDEDEFWANIKPKYWKDLTRGSKNALVMYKVCIILITNCYLLYLTK